MNTTLYAKDAKGVIREWSVLTTETGLIIEHGIKDGNMQHKTERVVPKGSRTMEEQVRSRYYSRCNRQFDKGYVETLEEAQTAPRTNTMGLKRPMKALTWKQFSDVDFTNAFYQHKYDGNRCVVVKRDGEMIAYSNNGKPLSNLRHITDSMGLYEGQSVDGELYCHGVSLQRIGSWIKRDQPETKNIQMRVYDTITPDPYYKRYLDLSRIDLGKNAFLVDTTRVDFLMVEDLFQNSLSQGYEGGMIRWGNAGYEDGKRSKSLIKLKQFEDDEFMVVDIIPSVDGWARLECETNEGKNFMVSAHGSMDNKYKIMNNYKEHLGRMVTVKYAYITEDGVPFHPVAKGWREDV